MFKTTVTETGDFLADLISTLFALLVMALIFWLSWTYWGIGAKYFAFIPQVYLNIPFWDTYLAFVAMIALKEVILPNVSIRLGGK